MGVRRWIRGVLAVAIAAAVAASASAASAAPSKPSAAPTNSGWSIQPTAPLVANPGVPTAGQLTSVSCTASSACAAAGFQGFDQPPYPLGEQWDGTSWSLQPTPPFQGTAEQWLGLSCSSATACTAVGNQTFTGGPVLPEAYRWDGTSWQAQTVPTPDNPPRLDNDVLTGVSCPSASACTAVGYDQLNGGGQVYALVERWDGSAWTIQATPSLSSDARLYGVSCPTTTSCVAVGSVGGSALAEVWDGTSWAVESVTAPSGALSPTLNGVSCPTLRSCTAVGSFAVANGPTAVILVERRSAGGRWGPETVPAPPGASDALLSAVSCPTQGMCTAVGNENVLANVQTLAVRGTGGHWQVEATPNPAGSSYSVLSGVSCPGRQACVAVGSAVAASAGITTVQPLAEQWSAPNARP